jgi:hypothetical protein
VVFGCVFAARSAAKTQPNTTNPTQPEQLPMHFYLLDIQFCGMIMKSFQVLVDLFETRGMI